MAVQDALLEQARAWRAQDPDPVTRDELDELVDAGDLEGLRDRFGSRLAFGTAGLRGELGAGPNRMNRVLVSQAAGGLAAYLVDRYDDPSIVIGYDGRVNSDVFARDTAVIMAGAGVRAVLLPRRLPTPVLAFAVRHLGVSAGVMVTASHNPARDNGYKVYLGGEDGGSQIVPPADGLIAQRIADVATRSIAELPRSNAFTLADESVLDAYVRQTAALRTGPTDIRFVYSAMHGVGWETASRVFEAAGFPAPTSVVEQQEPDASFPTVAFPNPEEPGAMDLAFAAAQATGADLAVVNDPDADRLGVAIPDAAGWRRLSGNEVGTLLGWRAAERTKKGTLAASIVSSPALRTLAEAHGLPYADTLTGFKWISRVGGLAFGYEEALGYLVDPGKVRDKDGISAAVDFLAMAAELKAEGRTVADRLDEFTQRFGAFASGQVSLRVDDLSDIGRMMAALRAQPPASVGGLAVDRIDDFIDGFEGYPPGDILRLWIGGSRVIVRPSGTEPKLKVYLDAFSDEGSVEERKGAAAEVIAKLEAGMRELLQA